MHYEGKKLAFYRGNLSSFVEAHPEAKSYYTLAATSVKFAFPPPGSLMGVRSNTRAILKMTNCTFTYPGKATPSLYDVSCALSLSRYGLVLSHIETLLRVSSQSCRRHRAKRRRYAIQCIAFEMTAGLSKPAGKSTMIKLLTGETEPQQGTVYRHPALRIGYVSQHATHHIGNFRCSFVSAWSLMPCVERHLEKSPVQYIQWRFQDGYDRELLEKATRVLTDDEKAQLEVEFVGKNGQRRKIEMIMGRSKLKKGFQYEIKWRG
jgi:elongation factor 3